MSNQIHNILTVYRQVLGRIDNQDDGMLAKNLAETEIQNDISEVVSSVTHAENSLKEVISVKESYKEILKMIM